MLQLQNNIPLNKRRALHYLDPSPVGVYHMVVSSMTLLNKHDAYRRNDPVKVRTTWLGKTLPAHRTHEAVGYQVHGIH